jgi:nucleolar pre-ribosomal-associated protein 2
LDQGDISSTADKLELILSLLKSHNYGSVQAAEEIVVRWLLKKMHGSTEEAERFRRYSVAWQILTLLFSSTPLFSLAKCLADRRFVHVIRVTLSDLSNPKDQAAVQRTGDSDTEMADAIGARPTKRAKLNPQPFDLTNLRQLNSCLQAAEAVFAALKSLLGRLEPEDDSKNRYIRMGAEHVKSLFSSNSTELKEIILPALRICELAINSETTNSYDAMSPWISTISTLWDLRLKGQDDLMEFATHLSHMSLVLLHKTRRLSEINLAKIPWTEDLGQFLTSYLILPARSAFVNRENVEAIQAAIDTGSPSDTTSCTAVFGLVLAIPLAGSQQSAKRDNEAWIRSVFEIIEHRLRSIDSREDQRAALVTIMNMALDVNAALPLTNLRGLCKDFALPPQNTDWTLLSCITKLNPDVFIADRPQSLLQEVLEQTISGETLSDEDLEMVSSFIITLIDGFVKARDLSGFIMLWMNYLSKSASLTSSTWSRYKMWYNDSLSTRFSQVLENSLNVGQVISILDWLDTHKKLPENAAVNLILAAISTGISQEEYTDAVGLRLAEMIIHRSLQFPIASEVLISRWTIYERTLQWSTPDQVQRIWPEMVLQLKETSKTVKESPLLSTSFHAFRCAAAAWISNYPGGEIQDAAASMTCDLLDRIMKGAAKKGVENNLRDSPYTDFLLTGSPILLR